MLAITLVIALPLEMAASAISGRQYPHYYTAWLPILALLAGSLFHGITQSREGTDTPDRLRWAMALTIVAALVPLLEVGVGLPTATREASVATTHQAVEYLDHTTGDRETVLMWGAETDVNYLARRRAPGRFVYQLPLFDRAYGTQRLWQAFLADIATSPAVIIDTTNLDANSVVPPIAEQKRRNVDDQWRQLLAGRRRSGPRIHRVTVLCRDGDRPGSSGRCTAAARQGARTTRPTERLMLIARHVPGTAHPGNGKWKAQATQVYTTPGIRAPASSRSLAAAMALHPRQHEPPDALGAWGLVRAR